MGDLVLNGTLNLLGSLNLEGDGGKVKINTQEALVEITPSDPAQCTSAAPVILPPPPSPPLDPTPSVRIINSFNKTIKAGGKNIINGGMVVQGDVPSKPGWPGMMLPGSATVTVSGLPANIIGDKAIIFPSGGSAAFTQSGQ